ncbi:N-acetyl-gamma-glutamyl-phosphate reductase [Catenulispora acidiphila DSM 44928]|uniref:N-acetyl-gamma-glutamyl-phosphate reductase n=1 Tax=Catenulispora acidiphila (strain DSM 44928 / JCM 14897 / NBRC 102108 / NRRL B-24433 / ID139908) TaxID=479433 RepID=C7QK84_CATAD|nr:N-acetyl-gamma-glutamyl-phosphate reductase [Catenulispora acidiphila]ACU75158.1 N-acetyl-gamma-glutamyl-phosphate reductase [Catenulispora acidiphila DSM 44928]
MVRVTVAGAAGYIGGELLRLLLGHPEIEVVGAVSSRFPGRRIDGVHPNLRSATDLSFCATEDVPESDAVFLALPHRVAMTQIEQWTQRSKLVIDLTGDFRLDDTAVYERYYDEEHQAPHLLDEFTPGLPELYRDQLRTADLISVPGCMATAGVLALYPLVAHDLIDPEQGAQFDARTGSSGSGATAGPANLHAERSGAMRVFAPTRHRHEAEISRHLGLSAAMTATGVEAVRGAQSLCHATLREGVDEQQVRRAFRRQYSAEPFVRVVAHQRGIHRYPDPKILLGSNFCDVGFAVDADTGRLTTIAALDNLVKGGAGNALQCLNIRLGLPETLGLSFPGLHPL